MALANMPSRNERSAPSFDETQPEELDRYFEELQALFDRHNVVDNGDRKLAAVKYLKIRTLSLWKTTSAWADPTKTYDEFKTEIISLYPGATSDRTYTIQDLDLVIGHYARAGILTGADLGEYYRRFLLISRYLISKNRLAIQEQSRYFFRGMQTQLEAQVRTRLQQKFIDHFPDDPYELTHIYEAASYVFLGTASLAMTSTQQTLSAPIIPSPAPDATSMKIEALTAMVATLGEMVKAQMQNQQQNQQAGARPQRSTGVAATGMSVPGTGACNYCGVPGHFIRECEVVAEHTRLGKCKRGPDGKVVLPSGAMVPRSIVGTWLRDRIEDYHRLNPGQMAATMLFEVAKSSTTLSNDTAGHAYPRYPTRHVDQYLSEEAARTYALNRPARLRPEVVITTRPPRHSDRVGHGENAGGASSDATPQVQRAEEPPPATQDTTRTKGKQMDYAPEQIHPYAAAPDAIYGVIPGPIRPPIREQTTGRPEPAYTTAAKVHSPQIAKTVYERAMETPITVTQRELLSLSPEVRAHVADITVKKRLPREQPAMVMIEEVSDEEEDKLYSDNEEDPKSKVLRKQEDTRGAHMPAAFVAAARALPPDATIIADPYEAYIRESANSDKPSKPVHVAAESNALRAILPTVDGQDKVEAILDPGCQIVAMSEEVCNALALPYDPTIRLHMVSANGGVDQSLGLARNVPFIVGEITLYLQVHVLRGPAYDILLGRPFDVLTQSVVRNFADENQTITILDPNTNRKATVPTIPRGSFRFAERRAPSKGTIKSQDF